MSSHQRKKTPALVAVPDTVEAFRATLPPCVGCLDCAGQKKACLAHALESALTISDVMTSAFRDSVPAAVEGERVPGLEQVLLAVRDLVRANAEALGEQDDVPGAVLQGLALQVDALVREVLR